MVYPGEYDIELGSGLPDPFPGGDGDLCLVFHANLARPVPGAIRLFLARALFPGDLAIGSHIARRLDLGLGQDSPLRGGDQSHQLLLRVTAQKLGRRS